MSSRFESLRWQGEVWLVHSGLAFARAMGSLVASADVHRFFVDRYLRLAEFHRKRGSAGRARSLLAKAAEHWHAMCPDEPPPANAAVMPLPLPPLLTWLVARGTLPEKPRKVA